MAITTVDGLIAGFKPPQSFFKAATGTVVSGRPFSLAYLAGIPGAAVAPSPGLSGAALTSYAGQIPFTNPTGGQNSYLARFIATSNGLTGTLLLVDRLWHNSGITITSNTAQTINSVAWPARDNNGTTNGEGVLIGLEVSGATGAGTPTLTLSYTNSEGTAGRTATNTVATGASSPAGSFYPISLQAGDVGVRSIQTYTQSATWTSGTVHLVAYRVLAALPIGATFQGASINAVTAGLPRLHDNTTPFLLWVPAGTASTNLAGQMVVAQG